MADSFIQVPPDSTGKSLDTRTAPDGNHREVITVGSPTLADVAEADAANGLDVDVTRVQGTVAVSNAALTALAGAIAGTEVQVDVVSGGGSGTQYTEDAAAPADPVGTALAMVRDDVLSGLTSADGDVVAARGTDKGELYVKHVDAIPVTDNAGSLTIDGTVTANAGTNLNTSALALEAGGNLAGAATSLAILDDWDESDRAKVNPIAGQAGVQGGSGVITALTQRVVLATDQPTVPVSLAAGGSTQYAEDSAHSSGDLVTMAGVVQQTADAALSSDGDRSVLQVDATGFVKTNVKSSALPTGASTLAEQQTQTTHLATIAGDTTDIEAAVEIMDDWDESDRAKVNVIVGQAGIAAGAGAVGATVPRVTLASDDPAVTALQILDNAISGSEMQVDVVAALPAGTNNIGDVDVLSMPVTEVVGDVAADAAVPANPLSIGGRASTAVPTAVSADGDSVYNWLNRLGMQVVSAIPGLGLNADPHTLLSETAQYTTTQTSTVLVAGGASERIVVTSVQIQVGGTTAGTLQVYFGTGAYARGTDEAIFDGEFAPSATLKPGIFMAPPGGFRAGALGDDILVTTSAAINPLTVTVWYYVLGV